MESPEARRKNLDYLNYNLESTHPAHYASYIIEPLEFIIKNALPFTEGNIIKYLCRWRTKGGLADLKKARYYLDNLIKEHENSIKD